MSARRPNAATRIPRSPGSRRSVARAHRQADLFAALGDASRLRLVARLCEGGPQSIVSLTSGSEITRQAVSKHLRVLKNAGLVRDIRRGRESRWEFEPRQLEI